ncbi:uncharacterized protein LOC131319871 [Rhododendron vialii]|uniref:uncharacterized protein LOC131319871 n=1 Tax=Rhododendron vialii TaxID=182163 RepID=UPI00265F5F49|nr:uncharacterized protein LOC131319871 [Rhododendron vialii]
MLMSMFSSFDALSAESFGQKVGFSWTPTSKEGKVVDASKGAPSTLSNESAKKGKVGNSADGNSTGTCDGRKQKKPQLRRPRFAPELDGVFCFETIVPY